LHVALDLADVVVRAEAAPTRAAHRSDPESAPALWSIRLI
jgi:hypothetical protein